MTRQTKKRIKIMDTLRSLLSISQDFCYNYQLFMVYLKVRISRHSHQNRPQIAMVTIFRIKKSPLATDISRKILGA